jgi:hypothetical protein
MRRSDVFFWLAAAGLLGLALYRVATPERPKLHPVSVEGLEIPSQPIATGQTVVAEKRWSPPQDVYVIGWSYHIGAPEARPELFLLGEDTTLFVARGGEIQANPAFFEGGTGFHVRASRAVTLRLRMHNSGSAGETHGAQALLYFVPVVGN